MTIISPLTKKMLALSMLQGVGPATLRKVVAQGLVSASVDVLSERISAIARALLSPDAWEMAQELAERQCDAAEKAEARIFSALDEGYPSLLSSTRDDPFLLYIKGQLSPTPEKSVAIIGTREPTKHGALIARRITEFFTEQHWSVVSGLALGCDALAHRAAIESKGHTVAVLAHGLQTVAPTQHRKLAQEILESGGALVSEYRFGQGALPSQFVKRDRTQAGLAQGVVMIQSDIKGGSLHASRAALDYERWLAVPFPTDADQASNEPKIQANLLIADDCADVERGMLLKCNRSRLSRIIVLRTKDDYPRMATAVLGGRESSNIGVADEVISVVQAATKSEHAETGRLDFVVSEEVEPTSGKPEIEMFAHDTSDSDLLVAPESQPESEVPIVKNNDEPQAGEQKAGQLDALKHASDIPKALKAKGKSRAKPKSKPKDAPEGELTVQQILL